MVNGRRIRELREAAGLTMVELAEKVYVSQTEISRVEMEVRSPSVALLKRIADYFDVPVDDLLKESAAIT